MGINGVIYFILLFPYRCVAGLANLSMGKYKIAAKSFLQVSVDHCDFPEVCVKKKSNIMVIQCLGFP